MRALVLTAALALVSVSSSIARAEQPTDQVQQLRRQIEALTQRLEQLEPPAATTARNERVTQIGASRGGHNPERIIKLYDVSDLFAVAPAYPARRMNEMVNEPAPLFGGSATPHASGVQGMGGFGGGMGMGGGMFNVGAGSDRSDTTHRTLPAADKKVLAQIGGTVDVAQDRTSLGGLMAAITQVISPDRWDDNGGDCSITAIGTTLLVSADASMHDQIEGLLDQFRQRWRSLRTVNLEARWLWLDAAQLSSLLAQRAGEPAAVLPTVIGDEAWGKLRAPADAAEDPRQRGYSAAISCYNGQTVHSESGSESLFVTGLTPVVGGEAPAGYKPDVTTFQDGVALQVTPAVTSGGHFIVLDVHSRVARLQHTAAAGREPQPAAERGGRFGGERVEAKQVAFDASGTPLQVAAAVDRPILVTQRLSTTVRMPVDRVVLVGGMTFAAESEQDNRGLYLFVKATAQEMRDDEPEVAGEKE